jgi:hypothetical protein
MNDEWKQKYREAIANTLRRMAADFVTLLPDVEGCQGCAGRGAGYCPTCKQSRYGTCGDCGKDLSREEKGQFRCELCSQYPSPEVKAVTGRSVHHDHLLKMLAIADDGPVVLSPAGKTALRWGLSMLNVLGDQIADHTGLPIPVVLDRASQVVEQSEEFKWSV